MAFLKRAIPGLFFFIFVFSIGTQVFHFKIPLMTGFKPQTSGVGSN